MENNESLRILNDGEIPDEAAPNSLPSSSSSLAPFKPTPIRRTLMTVDPAAEIAGVSVMGRIRQWNTIDNWCTLCKEPINTWNDHRGKREHICLELFYDRIVDIASRNWDPSSTLNFQKYFRREISMETAFDYYEENHESNRRTEIFAIIKYLMDHGILFIGKRMNSPSCVFSKHPVPFWGFVMLNKILFAPLTNIFPNAEAKDISALTQMVSGMFNLETVYDMINLRALIPPSEFPKPEKSIGNRPDVPPDFTFGVKGHLVRCLLGQLRWAVEPENMDCPFPEGVSAHHTVLCQRLVKMLTTELIACRLSEYVARVEGVWREQHAEWSYRDPSSTELAPLPSTHKGILFYYDGKLHSEEYTAMLRSDPSKKERRTVQFLSELQRSKK